MTTGIFEELLDVVLDTRNLLLAQDKKLDLLLQKIEVLNTMADTRLSAIDAELDKTDVVIGQIETQQQEIITDLNTVMSEEAALQARINVEGATLDTSQEVQRLSSERSRLELMQIALQTQLSALNSPQVTVAPGASIPNSSPALDKGVSTTSTPIDGTDTTASAVLAPTPIIHPDDVTTS